MVKLNRQEAEEKINVGDPELIRKAKKIMEMMSDIHPIFYCSSDLTSPDCLVEGILIVNGDLRAELLHVAPEDYGVCCIVLGNLHVSRMVFEGALFVFGSVQVDEVCFFDDREWGGYIGGNLKAKLMIDYQNGFNIAGKTELEIAGDYSAISEEFVYHDEGQLRIDPAPLTDAIISGRQILK